MNRIMMERNIEMAVGDARDAMRDRRKKCKAKVLGTAIDANLVAGDAKDWVVRHAYGIQNRIKESRYAVSDALDDVDYALFDDNARARSITLASATVGLTLLVIAVSTIRLGRKRTL